MASNAELINQMAEESAAGIRRGFEGIQGAIKRQDEMNQEKASYAMDRIEALNRVKQEVGVLLGEAVSAKVDETKEEIKKTILKERKLGKMRFGKTIDMSVIGGINSKIDQLSKLARNSKVMDRVYDDGVRTIEASKHITDKIGAKKLLTQAVVDVDKLENLDFQDIMEEIDLLVKNKSDINLVMADVLPDPGTSQRSYTFANDEAKAVTLPTNMQMDEFGNVSFTKEGEEEIIRAFNEVKAMGYTGDLADIKRNLLIQADSAYVKKEGDPFWKSLKNLQVEAARLQLKESKLEIAKKEIAKKEADAASGGSGDQKFIDSPFMNAAAYSIVYPHRVNALPGAPSHEDSLKLAGVDIWVNEEGKRQLRTKDDVDAMGRPIITLGPILDGSPESVRLVKEFLIEKMPQSQIERIDSLPKDPENPNGGYYWTDAWNKIKSGEAGVDESIMVNPGSKSSTQTPNQNSATTKIEEKRGALAWKSYPKGLTLEAYATKRGISQVEAMGEWKEYNNAQK